MYQFACSAKVDCLFDVDSFLQLLEVLQLATQILHDIFDLSLLDLTLGRYDFDIFQDFRAGQKLEELWFEISLGSLGQLYWLDVSGLIEEVDFFALALAVTSTLVEHSQI